MAENQYNSKIVLASGEVLMDLTQDTVVADKLLKGFTAHGKDGAPITGSCEFDADTGDATAGAAEILAGKTAYVTGSKVTGTMPNNGAKTLSITEKGKPVTIPQGYHDGSGKAQIDAAEEADPRQYPRGHHRPRRARYDVRQRGHEAAGQERHTHVYLAGGSPRR